MKNEKMIAKLQSKFESVKESVEALTKRLQNCVIRESRKITADNRQVFNHEKRILKAALFSQRGVTIRYAPFYAFCGFAIKHKERATFAGNPFTH